MVTRPGRATGTPGAEEYATVVVGAGSAGCALAGRLARHRRVLLLEAGPTTWTPEILDVASLAPASPGHPANWDHPVALRPGHVTTVPRGRVVGGSGAINGAVWCRATPADGWGQPGWTWADMLARYVRAETDADLGDRPGHGAAGPVPVRRPAGPLRHPTADRFLAAAATCGFPAEPDKNAGRPPGAGLVPSNAVDGVRVNPAMAYLTSGPAGPHASAVTPRSARCSSTATASPASGCATAPRSARPRSCSPPAPSAPHTCCCAPGSAPPTPCAPPASTSAPTTPASGAPSPTTPRVFLPFTTADPPIHPHAPAAQAALNLDAGADPAGDVEILLFARPFIPGGPLHLMCQLMRPDSRGTLTLPNPGGATPRRVPLPAHRARPPPPAPRRPDRRRAAARRAGHAHRARGRRPGLRPCARRLDRRPPRHRAAPLRRPSRWAPRTTHAVVDPALRVHGLYGLRVADLSVLPTAPRRGTAATAVAIGEAAAEFVGAGFPEAGVAGARSADARIAERDGAGWAS